ncbi:uncharacterized protein K460DRAFT_367905 [Cucurbitaria berberidis CBS 394.84]|uniref:Homeobox domain-containing protein n=1 Tax=Cucurbitaria berberidis CBS 394.84 TaxID=1168544 RepID=A0A9P4GBU7_9PLEO|nr:uncharacterized protein K460DRAFT_367905 [Cucurbitaria berberidis CBS 394.84]KAF1842988.1 hypothetical protein K460DRAFT_367905 [Cucurbitaria berberidis CBS 394.84]
MLSPNDIAPKSKAASIWSFDSGYGSTTLEDDEAFQVPPSTGRGSSCQADADVPRVNYHGFSSTHQTPPQPTQQPIGLGLGSFWNVHVEDQLRLTRPESPIGPVTTKLNVFTTKVGSSTDFLCPPLSDSQDTCVTCQLWNITNPGENLKCNDCRDKNFIVPQTPRSQVQNLKAKLDVPRLEIPYKQQPRKHSINNNSTRCSACEISSLIEPDRPSGCATCNPNSNLLSPISPNLPSKVKRSCARRPAKLPPRALQCLQAWLLDNRNNPYPGAETKRSLAQDCGITERQVTTWFTNARARRMNASVDRSNPQSEDEGNYETGFSSVGSTPICTSGLPFGYRTPLDRRCLDTSNIVANSFEQKASRTSRRGKKKDYSRMNTISPIDDLAPSIPPTPLTAIATREGNVQQTWQCTFCYQHIAPKSWRRHEETQHRPKRKWTCLLNGPRLTLPSRSNPRTNTSVVCAFCMAENPSEDHLLRSHRIVECTNKSEDERTFLRPDHLRQHVRNFHKATLWEVVRDGWRKDGPGKDEIENWVCGFCDQDLKTWDIRETHVAGHFKDGMTMTDWKESKRLEPTIESSKKRRNSNAEYSNMFTKIARTLTRRSTQHQHEHKSPLTTQFADAWDSITTSTDLCAAESTLLPDTIFDTFMAEVCGNGVDSCDLTATSSGEQVPASNDRYDSAFHDEEDMGLDFNTLTDAFLNGSFTEFQEPWDQQLE